jgi:hypothetical protein
MLKLSYVKSPKPKWPSREEWAVSQRALYYDKFEFLRVDDHLSSYATQNEIGAAVSALQTLWNAESVRSKPRRNLAGAFTSR